MISAIYHLALDAQLGRRVADGTVYLDNGMGGWVIDGQRGGCRLKKRHKQPCEHCKVKTDPGTS